MYSELKIIFISVFELRYDVLVIGLDCFSQKKLFEITIFRVHILFHLYYVSTLCCTKRTDLNVQFSQVYSVYDERLSFM